MWNFERLGRVIGRAIDRYAAGPPPAKPTCGLCGIAHSLPYQGGGKP